MPFNSLRPFLHFELFFLLVFFLDTRFSERSASVRSLYRGRLKPTVIFAPHGWRLCSSAPSPVLRFLFVRLLAQASRGAIASHPIRLHPLADLKRSPPHGACSEAKPSQVKPIQFKPLHALGTCRVLSRDLTLNVTGSREKRRIALSCICRMFPGTCRLRRDRRFVRNGVYISEMGRLCAKPKAALFSSTL